VRPTPHSDTHPQGATLCGLRVAENHRSAVRRQRAWLLLALTVCVGAALFLLVPARQPGNDSHVSGLEARGAPADAQRSDLASAARAPIATPTAIRPQAQPAAAAMSPTAERADFELPSQDPQDLAAYLRPGDPEPTMAEVIQGLREAGIHEGLAAFNPPGTVPLMPGIAVPEDFVLPPGYVRHYQVTDDGEMLEAVLMFSPDHTWLDANGRPMPMADDRLVPPEMAPPGLPIVPIFLPEPPRG
jgi:hypothetical protein